MDKTKTEEKAILESLPALFPNTQKVINKKYQGPIFGRMCPNAELNGGYMTLFGCLLMLVLMGVLFLCVDGILIHESESKSKMAAVGVGEHLLANYNVPLAKRYHVYFLDPEMKDKMENRARQYYEEMFSPTTSNILKSRTLLNLKVKTIQIKSYGTMQEQQCLYFRHQIKEYMKYDTAKDILLKTVGESARQISQQNQQIKDMKETLGQKEEAASEAQNGEFSQTTPTPSEKEKKAALNAQKQDPRKIVQKVMKSGVLEFVTGGNQISDKKLVQVSLPSGAQKERQTNLSTNLFGNLSTMKNLLQEQKVGEVMNQLEEDGFAYRYVKKHFNNYRKKEQIQDTVMKYEMEYIIGGQETDRENLKYVVNRLLMLRFTLNFIYASKDAELNSQALSMATALVGATGMLPVIEGVKYTILGAASFGEALLDVKSLMEGKKIPIIKNKSNWSFSLTSGAAALGKNDAGSQNGLNYEEYLVLLLSFQLSKNKMYLRMQDLMQMNTQQEQPGFLIEQCMFGFQMDSQIQTRTWFGHGTYEIHSQRIFSY